MNKKHTFYYLFLAMAFSLSCTTSENFVQQRTDIFYQKDIKFKVEKKDVDGKLQSIGDFRGSAVVPEGNSYKITLFPEGKADLLSISSCHREIRTQDPDKKFFDKGYSFELDPVKSIESGRDCKIDLAVYEQKKGRNAWGFLAFENEKFKMPANIKCNGEIKSTGGVSICQSRKGLIQQYIFDRKVEAVFNPECDITSGQNGKNDFTFIMPRGPCTIYFIDVAIPKNVHQANLYGYDEILLKD